MLDFFVMIPSMFSGAALWLLLSKWLGTKDDEQERSPDSGSAAFEPDRIQPNNTPDAGSEISASSIDQNPSRESSRIARVDDMLQEQGPIKMVKCNCGLEFPEEAMREHAQSTGHSKPFDPAAVRIAKIWDLEEAVIENASPQCIKCGKPVLGLKRIGKTIYVTHLGCSDEKQETKSTRTVRKKPQVGTCLICWRPIHGKSGITTLDSLAGPQLMFHEDCLRLQSSGQIISPENSPSGKW